MTQVSGIGNHHTNNDHIVHDPLACKTGTLFLCFFKVSKKWSTSCCKSHVPPPLQSWTSTTAKNSACPAGLILLLHSMENNSRELRGSVCCDHYSQDRSASLEGLHHIEYSIPYQEKGCEITSTSYTTL